MAYGNTPNKKRTCYKMKAGAEGPFRKNFPDLTGDGEVTKADILKGRGVLPQRVKTDAEQRKEYIQEQIKKGR